MAIRFVRFREDGTSARLPPANGDLTVMLVVRARGRFATEWTFRGTT